MNAPSAFTISIQTVDFDLGAELTALRAQDRRVGALCSFVGLVRDHNDGDAVGSLELEHYPGMTEKPSRPWSMRHLRAFRSTPCA